MTEVVYKIVVGMTEDTAKHIRHIIADAHRWGIKIIPYSGFRDFSVSRKT